MNCIGFFAIFVLFSIGKFTSAIELTFELEDNARDCFYELIEQNVSTVFEYQVVTGGQYDVDVMVAAPTGRKLYEQFKSQFDSYTFVAQESGVYELCFSNEFSTISHKIVYMDLQVGEEKPLPSIGEHITVMTLMEASALDVHRKLNDIIDYQTHHRLRETSGRKRAEDLNQTVFWWCFSETCLIIITMITQVLIVRNFFSETGKSRYRKF